MSDTPVEATTLTQAEKEGIANDLNTLANMIVEQGQYIFNLIAAVNVQQEILLEKKIVTEDELKTRIGDELNRMKGEFEKAQATKA